MASTFGSCLFCSCPASSSPWLWRVLAKSESARRLHRSAASISIPKCPACVFAKQRRRSTHGSTTAVVQDRVGALRKDNLSPGQKVSVDHFICSQKGRLFTSRGKETVKDKYCGGCIFVDHASNYIHVEFQQVLTSHATLEAKTAYEAHCRDFGVIPLKFLSDNGRANLPIILISFARLHVLLA
jgi:hypothetical protein